MALETADELEYLALLEAQYDAEPLPDFVRRVTPHWPPPDHVAPLRDLIERTRHEEVQAVISLPPRHVKTKSIQAGLAWRLQLDPADTHAYVTYQERLAHTKSLEIQRLAREAGVPPGDTTSARLWTTPQGGGLLATGIGGAYTGMGTTGVQVIDDPYPNPEKAFSIAYREKVWQWFDGVARNRREPGASCIVCHTRWHEDDLIGRLLEEERGDWEEFVLPAVWDFDEAAYEEYAALKKRGEHHGFDLSRIGRALWPEYYPIERLLPFMSNRYFWWSLFMQSPRPLGERLFGEPGAPFFLDSFRQHGCRVAIVVDPATTPGGGDYSAIGEVAMRGYGADAEMFVLRVTRGQWTTPQLCRRILEIQRARAGWWVVVEAVGGFKAVPQTLREIEPQLRIHEIQPTSDKWLRAQPVSAAWNDGRVHLARGADWVPELVAECQRFTGLGDKADDQVDMLAHGWNTLYKESPGTLRGTYRLSGYPFG